MRERWQDGAQSRFLLLTIAYVGFVSLGLPDPVVGVAWPSVRGTFSVPQSAFGLVFVGLGCGYCASGFFGGKLTQILGLGNLLWISSGLVAIAMVGSGLAPVWPLFIGCAVIWGLGSGGIDAGLNAYVSNHFSARHVNWLHACYSLGATLGPLVMTAILVRVGSWRYGYVFVGGILLAMTAAFFVTRQRWSEPSEHLESGTRPPLSTRAALREPMVLLQMVLFFLYCGLEFTVGQWSFTLLTDARGVRTEVAGALAGGFYGAIGVGRILAGIITHRIGLDSLLRLSMLGILVGSLLFAFSQADWSLIFIGLGLAPIFPCLMSSTPQRLSGDYATHAIGFQVSAGMLGAALMPGFAGLLVRPLGLECVAQFAVLLAALLLTTHELLLYVAGDHLLLRPR